MTDISKNRSEGGYGVLDTPLYMQLLFVKQIKNYVQIKIGSSQWDVHCFFLEIYCTRWVFKTVNVDYSNLVPHAFKPSVHCQECINVIS